MVLGFGGGGGGGALVWIVVGAIAVGAAVGALVTGGGIGAALVGGSGGAVVVVSVWVGRTTPVGPNGSRDTTVIAETTTPTATTPSRLTVTGPNQVVQDQRSCSAAACAYPVHLLGVSELLNLDCLIATAGFRGEDEPDPARVVLVFGRRGGVE